MNAGDVTLLTFKSIADFVNNLCDEYGNTIKSLKLYRRLINHTQIGHAKAIEKHIALFRDFSVTNSEALLSQDYVKLVSPRIEYSTRVYIDMDVIFKKADSENAAIIWKHLLTISALVDPSSEAKKVLKNQESDFLADIIGKVEKNVSPNSTPAEAMISIMSSGLLTELFGSVQSGISSGKLDMGKLLGSMQGLIGDVNDKAGDNPELKQMLGTITSMMGGGSESGGMPDLQGLMQAMSGMMQPKNLIEEKKD